MLTDRQNKIFSILKNTSEALILKRGNEKYIRKTFILEEKFLNQLVRRQHLSHPNLINIYQIEFSHSISQEKSAVEIVYEHYCHTLQQCIVKDCSQWEDAQIINTFQQIIQVVDYLVRQKSHLADFSLKNIVTTESQHIKYLDNFLLDKEIGHMDFGRDVNNFNSLKIYETVAQKIYSIVFPHQCSKSWKSRMKIVKQRSSKELYTFIAEVLSKSLSKGYDSGKTKKIKKSSPGNKKKENIKDVIKKCPKQQKCQKQCTQSCRVNLQGKHQGKQNKLQQ